MTHSDLKGQTFHFIGIGGIGMSGLARIVLQRGATVSGSDLRASLMTEELQHQGASIVVGHCVDNVPAASAQPTVVYSTDVPDNNVELEYARTSGSSCRLLHRSVLLAELLHEHKALAVAGTHGKTTTSCLLTHVLNHAERSPSFAVGGVMVGLDTNASAGDGDLFVIEADESDGSFLQYLPTGAIVTNIEWDHLDHFGSTDAILAAFRSFIDQVYSVEHLFWCGDDPILSSLAPAGISYGFGKHCVLRLESYRQERWSGYFDLSFRGQSYSNVQVALPGRHNALNAAAVFGLARTLGVEAPVIRAALKSFAGIKRRCEVKGDVDGILVLDDYAHHPTEIAATLGAVRAAMPKRRLLAVFQPHRYSRTQQCLGQFSQAFSSADHVVITDVYGKGEPLIPSATHNAVVAELEREGHSVSYLPRVSLATQLFESVTAGDVAICLGAGDITRASEDLVSMLRRSGVSVS